MQKKILITESSDASLMNGLTALGYECIYEPGISQMSVQKIIPSFTGIIVATRITINKTLLDAAVNLRFIARAGSGMENIDKTYAESLGMVCISSPEGNANAVGEHALGLMLAFFHNIVRSNLELLQLNWKTEENRVHEMEGRTIGIIGYGNTGKAFAKKIAPLGMQVLAYDKYQQNFTDTYVTESSLDDIFSSAEIVSLHIPLTEETFNFADMPFFKSFMQPVFLINTSRGRIIDHSALLECLHANEVLGAALDVYENEKPETHNAEERRIFNGLLNSRKVIFTPHIAGKSFEAKRKIAAVLIQKIGSLDNVKPL